MENKELLEYIYKIVDMGSNSCIKLLKDLKGKDNKIIDVIEDIKKEYLSFETDIKKLVKKEKIELDINNFMAKMGSSMEMKMEVMMDNSDSKIADMLIRGTTMGVIETEKYIKKFEDKADKKILELARDLLEFQNNSVEKLKEYL